MVVMLVFSSSNSFSCVQLHNVSLWISFLIFTAFVLKPSMNLSIYCTIPRNLFICVGSLGYSICSIALILSLPGCTQSAVKLCPIYVTVGSISLILSLLMCKFCCSHFNKKLLKTLPCSSTAS